MNRNFQSTYLPSANISDDESITLWKGHLGIRRYIPLKAAKFETNIFELCESSTGHLWHFNVYIGAGIEVTPGTDVPDQFKSSKIVVKLSEPLMNKGQLS
jgi:hypothetical protein